MDCLVLHGVHLDGTTGDPSCTISTLNYLLSGPLFPFPALVLRVCGKPVVLGKTPHSTLFLRVLVLGNTVHRRHSECCDSAVVHAYPMWNLMRGAVAVVHAAGLFAASFLELGTVAAGEWL